MTFARDSKFTKFLVKNGFLKANPLTVVDIGARGGTEPHWGPYGGSIRFIGFEPDKEECEKLNQNLPEGSEDKFYPVALHKDKGERTFYIQAPSSSGFYEADPKLVKRFVDEDTVRVRGTAALKTTDLDSFAAENNFPEIDFIKTDAEGGDFDIIQGAAGQLRKSVLGISSELYISPWRGEGRGLTEAEQFLRPLGFLLYNIDFYRFATKAFPGIASAAPDRCGVAPYGQLNFCQAVFLRDAVAEIEGKKLMEADWNEERVLKMASLYEHFNLPDCAIELLEVAGRHGILSKKIDLAQARDLIVSGYFGRNVKYEDYMKKLERIQKRGYLNLLEYLRPKLRKIPGLKATRDIFKKGIGYISSFKYYFKID
jgi:FkbM family methyltransferase